MIQILLILLLTPVFSTSCPKTTIENTSNYKWNKFDFWTFKRAKTRCPQIYKDAPCLKLFRKHNKQDYHAICGVSND